jgi:hypothetical protein
VECLRHYHRAVLYGYLHLKHLGLRKSLLPPPGLRALCSVDRYVVEAPKAHGQRKRWAAQRNYISDSFAGFCTQLFALFWLAVSWQAPYRVRGSHHWLSERGLVRGGPPGRYKGYM